MKFLNNEIIPHENVKENTLFVFGGHKKSYIGYFQNTIPYVWIENKGWVKSQSSQIKVLVTTDFQIHEIHFMLSKYNKEWFDFFKNELVEKRAKYTAAILTKESGQKLYETMKSIIPEYWTVNCHHMTICLGEPVEAIKSLIGKSIQIRVVGYTYSEEFQLISVKVETDVYSKNENKHITVALDKENGAQAVNSNKITSYHHLDELILTATIDSVLNNGKTRNNVSEFNF